MGKVVGIDLGTTNSCVAVMSGDGPRVLPVRTGQGLLPSMVAVSSSGRRLVGHLAKRQALTNPKDTISGVKRFIGRRWDLSQVQELLPRLSYPCVRGPNDDVRICMGGRDYAAAEISSMVLQELRLGAEEALNEPVTQAVLTVPAHFNDNQRQATRAAGRIAGLEVVRIINEPTAAALAYGFGKDLDQKVAIYDLGGGTFDISLVDVSQGVFSVLATAGDAFLGGEDFDERILELLVREFARDYGVDLHQDSMALQRLRDAAERAKIDLSELQEVVIDVPFVRTLEDGTSLHIKRQLTREELEGLVAKDVERTLSLCQETVAHAGLARDDLTAVILAGGMTRMPLVQREVVQHFGVAVRKGVHPDEVVACGAAIQGHLLGRRNQQSMLLDVASQDLGIMVAGGGFETVIRRNSTLPTCARRLFTTVRDNQEQVRVIVMQGVSSKAADNELLGEFLFEGLSEAPTGKPKLEVAFQINADGIVSVSARDLDSGREYTTTLRASSGLSEEEIQRMMAENEAMAVRSVTLSQDGSAPSTGQGGSDPVDASK